MVFHVLLTKRRPLEARHETKDFKGEPGTPWILTKNFQFHFARYFSPIFLCNNTVKKMETAKRQSRKFKGELHVKYRVTQKSTPVSSSVK